MSLDVSFQSRRRGLIRNSLPAEHPAGLDEISALVDALPEPTEMSAEEIAGSPAGYAQARNKLDAWFAAVAGEADSRKVSRLFAAGTAGTMVAAGMNASTSIGSGIVATGRDLRDLPWVAKAYRKGLISTSHVLALRKAAPQIQDFAANEPSLVALAMRVDPKELRRLLDVLIAQSMPEAPDVDHHAQHEKRRLSLYERDDGMWKLDGLLDGIAGAKLFDSLQPLMAREGQDDPRGPMQRRADALDDLVSMARANTRPLGVSGLSVLVDVDNLPEGIKAALEDGTLLGPDTFDWASCSVALAVVFGQYTPRGFRPLELARTKRRATNDQWAALIARDRGCVRCGKAPRYTEAHHIVHWRNGGLTELSNLCLLCARCHHDLHMGYFDVRMGDDGIPVITVGRGPPGRRAG